MGMLVAANSLPHRQLRNYRSLMQRCRNYSLPHRQLRKTLHAIGARVKNSLPHRQLRKSGADR